MTEEAEVGCARPTGGPVGEKPDEKNEGSQIIFDYHHSLNLKLMRKCISLPRVIRSPERAQQRCTSEHRFCVLSNAVNEP